MRKLVCFALCIVFAFSLCGCSKDKDNSKVKSNVNVEKYALSGKMPEVDYALGQDVDALLSDLDKLNAQLSSNAEHESLYMTYEIGERTIIATGEVNYYYNTDKKDDGISYIVNFGNAFGFEQGSILSDVKDKMENRGFSAERKDVHSDDLFFLPMIDGLEVLEYKFKDRTVLFVFQNNCLCACSLF